MPNYTNNLEKYSRMSKKQPELTPTMVTADRFLGLCLMVLFGLMGIIMMVSALAHNWDSYGMLAEEIAVALLCLAVVIIGNRRFRLSGFYEKSRRYLKNPGTVPLRVLAGNTGHTAEETLKLVESMIRSKYYRNLSISEDKKSIIVKPAQQTGKE